MDEKEVKQEEDIETESSEEIDFYWDLFNIDLCDIIRTDLKSLFTEQLNPDDGNNNADSISFDTKQQETAAQKKQINENGQILISNIYGKMFILYPAHNTLITFDSNRLTNYLNETQTDPNNKNLIPERGIPPPHKLYRVFTNIIANKMKLSFNQKHIALCSNTSFKVYHIAQFFNEIHPAPQWKIEENVFQFDWNENSLFLVIDRGNKRTLKHYTLLNKGYKLIGTIPSIPHDIITEIKVLSKDIFAVCLANGFVIIYKYSISGEYHAIHSVNINKQHSKSSNKTIPYLITDMKGCNSICVHYGVQSAQTADKYLPYFCIFKYDSLDFKAVQCVLCEHTGLNEINNDFKGIKSLYIGGELDYLIFCCRYDYMLSVYDANRNVLDTKGFVVKYDYDEDRDNGNVCDVGIDYTNTVACMDLETDQNTLPPVPIVYILTNKLNIGCFNIIPYDTNYNDKQLLAIMRTSIPIDNDEMLMHILDKYKKLFCGNNDDDSIADISAILTFADDENDAPAVQTPDDTDTDNKQSANIVSKPVSKKKEKAALSAAIFDHNVPNEEVPIHILDKYKKLYCGYFKQLYLKYAPQAIGKIAKLMQKYSSSYAQLQRLYEKLITKYKVDQNDIKPFVSIQEIEQMQFDENGDVIVQNNNNNNEENDDNDDNDDNAFVFAWNFVTNNNNNESNIFGSDSNNKSNNNPGTNLFGSNNSGNETAFNFSGNITNNNENDNNNDNGDAFWWGTAWSFSDGGDSKQNADKEETTKTSANNSFSWGLNDSGGSSWLSENDLIDMNKRVTVSYGSRIKLEHFETQYRLHSHKANYPNGSKQQQVTCFSREDVNDWWVVKPHYQQKESLQLWQKEVKHGDIITLQHFCTGNYLHSHNGYPSALSKQQQEVTCYWNKRDRNNNWKLEVHHFNANVWKRGQIIKLIHCATNHTLHSHEGHNYPDYGFKQQEVTAFSKRDGNDNWFVSKVEKEQWYL